MIKVKFVGKLLICVLVMIVFSSIAFAESNLYKAGVIFYKQGKYDQALKYLSDAVKKDPDNIEALYYFANVLVKTRNLDYAEKYYQKVIEIDSGSKLALYSMQALDALREYKNKINLPRDSLILKNKQIYSSENSYIKEVMDYGAIIHWKKTAMPLNVYIEPSRYKEYEKFVWDAFKNWETSSSALVTFNRVDQEEKAHIIVNWDNKYIDKIDYDLSGYVYPYYNDKELLRFYIHLVDHDREGKVLLPKDLTTYALHLIGHSLGITVHSKNKNDIMFISGNDGKLSRGDISTLHILYGLKADISNFSDATD